jgi:pyruvate dehydrogenase E1 component beta subunit
MASVTERVWSALKAPPARVAYPDVICPFSPVMERFALPDVQKIIAAVDAMLRSTG